MVIGHWSLVTGRYTKLNYEQVRSSRDGGVAEYGYDLQTGISAVGAVHISNQQRRGGFCQERSVKQIPHLQNPPLRPAVSAHSTL